MNSNHQGGAGTNQYQARGRAAARPAPSFQAGAGLLAQASSLPTPISDGPPIPPARAAQFADASSDLRQLGYQSANDMLRDPQPTSHTLQQLGQSGNPLERSLVAAHPSCPPELARQLAHDPDPGVAMSMGFSPSCRPEVLSAWAASPSIQARLLAARHPETPAAAIQQLAARPETQMLAMRHPNYQP